MGLSSPPNPAPELDISELPGCVWFVPNSLWGIPDPGSSDHPGACLQVLPERKAAGTVKGTDAAHRRRGPVYVVEPDGSNGLTKATSFQLELRLLRLHKIRTYHTDRYLGRLSVKDLRAMQARLRLSLAPEEGH
jgi:hypothetical protein